MAEVGNKYLLNRVLALAIVLATLNICAVLNNFEADNAIETYEETAVEEVEEITTYDDQFPREVIKGLVVIKTDNWAATIAKYQASHNQRCEKEWENRPEYKDGLCQCVPRETLVGFVNVTFEDVPLEETADNNPEVMLGGHWNPSTCMPRYRISIIVPFRDRAYHLRVFLRHLHPILQGQQVDYRIIVVEQNLPALFNKATLMNIGYVYTKREHQPDCVIFHDVDHIPQDGRHFYYCPELPYHLGAWHDEHRYKITYPTIFGAATAFRPAAFEQLNGFSNRFWGWGGEDDDMGQRVLKTFKLKRLPRPIRGVAGFKRIPHERDARNQGNLTQNKYILKKDRQWQTDGLTSLRFRLKRVVKYPLYTWILADLTARPEETTSVHFVKAKKRVVARPRKKSRPQRKRENRAQNPVTIVSAGNLTHF